eukprot:m.362704 g.362704  ORF g.362704 m.362704 type:complete len:50 (-) comp20779_c0_seq1:1499-1648(-)
MYHRSPFEMNELNKLHALCDALKALQRILVTHFSNTTTCSRWDKPNTCT